MQTLLTKQDFALRAKVMKALAHPTRLMLVDELSRGECTVAQLTALAGVDMSTVSKHLSLLKEVGVVTYDKRGVQVFYSLRTPCVLDFFECLENILASGNG